MVDTTENRCDRAIFEIIANIDLGDRFLAGGALAEIAVGGIAEIGRVGGIEAIQIDIRLIARQIDRGARRLALQGD